MAGWILRREVGGEHAVARDAFGPEIGLEEPFGGLAVQRSDGARTAADLGHRRVAGHAAGLAEGRERGGVVFRLPAVQRGEGQKPSGRGLGLSLTVAFALLVTWIGLGLSYFTDYPVGFFVTNANGAGDRPTQM